MPCHPILALPLVVKISHMEPRCRSPPCSHGSPPFFGCIQMWDDGPRHARQRFLCPWKILPRLFDFVLYAVSCWKKPHTVEEVTYGSHRSHTSWFSSCGLQRFHLVSSEGCPLPSSSSVSAVL